MINVYIPHIRIHVCIYICTHKRPYILLSLGYIVHSSTRTHNDKHTNKDIFHKLALHKLCMYIYTRSFHDIALPYVTILLCRKTHTHTLHAHCLYMSYTDYSWRCMRMYLCKSSRNPPKIILQNYPTSTCQNLRITFRKHMI